MRAEGGKSGSMNAVGVAWSASLGRSGTRRTVLLTYVPIIRQGLTDGGACGSRWVHLHYEHHGDVPQVWVSFLMKNSLTEVCTWRENSLNGV